MSLKPLLKGKLQRKYTLSNKLHDSKYCLLLNNNCTPKGSKPYSSKKYLIGGVAPVLYSNNSDNKISAKLANDKVNQKNLKKVQHQSLPKAFKSDETKFKNIPTILERIEANDSFLKKEHKPESSIFVRKKSIKKTIIKIEEKNTYLLPELKQDIEKKDIKSVIFSQPVGNKSFKYQSDKEIRLVANDFYKWMESIGKNEPRMTVSSLFSLLLSSFEIKPALAINLEIVNETELVTGSRRYSTELEVFTFGEEQPAYLDYFDKNVDKKVLFEFKKLFQSKDE